MASDIDLYKEWENKGNWWLPEKPKNKVRGRINFNPTEGARVFLDGSFWGKQETFNNNFKNPDLILGELENGYHVTLKKTIVSNIRGQLFGDKPDVTIYANHVLYGYAPDTNEEITFKKCGIQLDLLEKWFGVHVFKNHWPDGDTTKNVLTYTPPEEFEACLDDSTKLSSNSWITSGGNLSFSEAKLLHKRELIITADEPMSLEWFQDKIWSITQLVSLLTGERLRATKIRFPMNVKYGDREGEFHDVLFLYRPEMQKSDKSKHPIMMPFPHTVIKEQFEAIIQKWQGIKTVVEDPINLFFSTYFKRGSYSQLTFLAVTQACESFHKHLRGPKEMEHKKRILALFNEVPEGLKPLLVSSPDNFFQKSLDSRNYYTHYTKSKKEKSFQGVELYWATQKLSWIFIIVLYKELGFTDQEIEKRICQNDDFVAATRISI